MCRKSKERKNPTTDHGSKQRSFLEVVLGNDRGDLNTLACHWGVVRRSDHLVGLPTSLRAEPSFGKYHCCSFDDHRHIHKSAGPVLSATSYAAPALGHKYPLHPQSYQPVALVLLLPSRFPCCICFTAIDVFFTIKSNPITVSAGPTGNDAEQRTLIKERKLYRTMRMPAVTKVKGTD